MVAKFARTHANRDLSIIPFKNIVIHDSILDVLVVFFIANQDHMTNIDNGSILNGIVGNDTFTLGSINVSYIEKIVIYLLCIRHVESRSKIISPLSTTVLIRSTWMGHENYSRHVGDRKISPRPSAVVNMDIPSRDRVVE